MKMVRREGGESDSPRGGGGRERSTVCLPLGGKNCCLNHITKFPPDVFTSSEGERWREWGRKKREGEREGRNKEQRGRG